MNIFCKEIEYKRINIHISHQVQQINLLLPIRNNFPVGGTINSRGWNILTTLANWENIIITNMDYTTLLHIAHPSSLINLFGIRFDHSWVKSLKVYKSCRHVWNINGKLDQNLDLGTASWDCDRTMNHQIVFRFFIGDAMLSNLNPNMKQ